jgi:hypothetical protein
MSLTHLGADKKAERVCNPKMRIGDRPDNSAQPSGGVSYKPSEQLECGLWPNGRTGHRQTETSRDGLQASCSIYSPSEEPTLPAAERRFICGDVGTRRVRNRSFDALCIVTLVGNKQIRQLMMNSLARLATKATDDKLYPIPTTLIPYPPSASYDF